MSTTTLDATVADHLVQEIDAVGAALEVEFATPQRRRGGAQWVADSGIAAAAPVAHTAARSAFHPLLAGLRLTRTR